ncbi:MAG: peptidoglycan DD-metalloendopeptidase family protein [Desulfobacteraceae bacterium]|nr:peptidoglycan DD-metalloendopeptidase family protein [Desulfobacteraceae bacterium]
MRTAAVDSVVLSFPLRIVADDPYYGYYFIPAFVDHNDAYPDQLLDYYCGKRTYDMSSGYNHEGTDYCTWPLAWKRMAHDEVEVVAAASGVIVGKDDGYYDKNCTRSGDWNAVYIQHSDDSQAWYGHLKNGSLTQKSIGDSVTEGEYLGVVGSSGNSTGPHLHFEIHDSSGKVVDPYYGECNTTTDRSWWKDQPPYYESCINKVILTSNIPDIPDCPEDETTILDDKSQFAPGERIYISVFYRDILTDQTTDFTVQKPDGTTYFTWQFNSEEPYPAVFFYWYIDTPSDADNGRWLLQLTFNGQTYEHEFNMSPTLTPCPECSGSPVELTNVTFESGRNCECSDSASITIGTDVTIKSGATVTFKAPTVKLQSYFHAENGSTVNIKQQ